MHKNMYIYKCVYTCMHRRALKFIITGLVTLAQVSIYIYIYTRKHININVNKNICICICIYVHIYVHMYMHRCVRSSL